MRQLIKSKIKQKKAGFVTLISVIIIGFVALSIAVGVLLIGIGADQATTSLERGALARSYAEACAETALYELKLNNTYAAGAVINFTYGSCTVTAITGTGDTNRVVQVTGSVSPVVKKIQVNIAQINPTMTLTSWQEVADF